MPQVTGICKVYVNGSLYRTLEGAKINVGGYERTPVVGHSYYGTTQKLVPATVTFDIAHMADTDLVELGAIEDATLRFECDTGQTYMVANASWAKPSELTGGDGKATGELVGEPAIKE